MRRLALWLAVVIMPSVLGYRWIGAMLDRTASPPASAARPEQQPSDPRPAALPTPPLRQESAPGTARALTRAETGRTVPQTDPSPVAVEDAVVAPPPEPEPPPKEIVIAWEASLMYLLKDGKPTGEPLILNGAQRQYLRDAHLGSFTITEKTRLKRSNLYDVNGDPLPDKKMAPENGAVMRNWMRIGGLAVGLHYSPAFRFRRSASARHRSHGCYRMSRTDSAMVFRWAPTGTPVHVVRNLGGTEWESLLAVTPPELLGHPAKPRVASGSTRKPARAAAARPSTPRRAPDAAAGLAPAARPEARLSAPAAPEPEVRLSPTPEPEAAPGARPASPPPASEEAHPAPARSEPAPAAAAPPPSESSGTAAPPAAPSAPLESGTEGSNP